MMRRALLPLLVLTLLSLSVAALAENGNGRAATFNGGLYLFGRTVPTVVDDAGVVGLGYEMNIPIGQGNWGLTGDFGYGIGNIKETQTGPGGTFEDELEVTHWAVRVGFDHWEDCCDKIWYGGPAFTYMSSKGTIKSTGSPDFELEPYTIIGLDTRIGGSIKLSPKLNLYGQTNFTIGRASWEQADTVSGDTFKEEKWVTMPGWRGGLRLNY